MIWVSLVLCILLFELQAIAVVKANSGHKLTRREVCILIPLPRLWENVNYTQFEAIHRIHSDYDDDETGNIEYSLEGIGANQDPVNVFVVDPNTGYIRVTKVLDREIISMYNLLGVIKFKNGTQAVDKVPIRIKVLDENDNAPVFGFIKPGEVYELSAKGTSVMKITATDADEPGTINSKIAYSIVDQDPPDDMFSISKDGTIYVKNPALDREKVDQYTLTVMGQDLDGFPGGLNGTGTVTINVKDVNDNPPTLEKEKYEGSIVENKDGVEVMRIKAEDLDLKGTDNWEVVYDIVSGNEGKYFSITTDPKTNEGILMLNKAVNYEDVKDLDLKLAVRNKAPLYDGTGANAEIDISLDGEGEVRGTRGAEGTGGVEGTKGATGAGAGVGSGGTTGQIGTLLKTYPIKINVINQPEGPAFDPKAKAIPISKEGHPIDINKIVASYLAKDEDTGKPADNVRYAKGSDPANWLTIDPETADIKLKKRPDRESPYLVNGTYYAKVLCITEDMPAKTATGTIAIQVEDFNDHCPILTSDVETMCIPHDGVIVTAKDEDLYPNGAPFDFVIIPEGTQGKWRVEHLNDTAAILRAQEPTWPGFYEVQVGVSDQQGKACPEPQKVMVQVCECDNGVV